jgi:hypothetical protein
MPPFPAAWLAHEGVKEALAAGTGTETARSLCSLFHIGGEQCAWPDLPILAWAAARDPIHLRGGDPYRFQIVLRDYHRLPNNVVLRFVVATSQGHVFSDYFYLLAM